MNETYQEIAAVFPLFHYSAFKKLCKEYQIRIARGIYGGYQAILWDDKNKVYHGASESRKDGQASGY